MAKAKRARKSYNPQDSIIIQIGVAFIVVASIAILAYAIKIF